MSAQLRRRLGMALTLALAAAGGASTAAHATGPQVVADGLANPRGITVGPDGRLYVAEAGRGGDGTCVPNPEEGEPNCVGATGAITAIDPWSGRKRTVVGGLPSLAPQAGPEAGGNATGPQDVSFHGRQAWFTVGLGGDVELRESLGDAGAAMGKVHRRTPWGAVEEVADLAAYEEANDPDAGSPGVEGPDSNPFSIDATRAPLVTDAGGNDLLRLTPRGRIRTVAVFPFSDAPAPPFLGLPPGTRLPVQPVPTGVVRGPWGAAYVGSLTGFPFPVGGADVFRVLGPGWVTRAATGFTNVIDVAFGPDRSLYVLSIAANGLLSGDSTGRLVRISPWGGQTELAAGRLTAPAGVTVTRHGAVYVTNRSVSGTAGEVVRVR